MTNPDTPTTTLPIDMMGRDWSWGHGEHAPTAGWPGEAPRFLIIRMHSHAEELACATALAAQDGRKRRP